MARERDYSLHCCVDSDMPCKDIDDPGKARNPGSHRPHLGYYFSIAGGAVDACSRRQHSTVPDTAAAEMFAASAAGAVAIHIVGVTRFLSFGVLGDTAMHMWCDNEAAVCAGNDAGSIKRLAYIARRVRFLQELVTCGVLRLLNVPGNANPADAFTKHISPKTHFRDLMARVYNASSDVLMRVSARPGKPSA
jgi:hypothetical protein